MTYIEAEKGLRDEFNKKQGALLVKYGFIVKEDEKGSNVRRQYKWNPSKGEMEPSDPKGKLDPEHAQMEYAEDILLSGPYEPTGAYVPTGYPNPLKRYHILYESYNLSIEETYFWLVDHMRYDQGYNHIHKVRDVFTATENSAFFGMSQQRVGLQQDRVQQYLATIGKMVKDLFQLVRELRILDEKMEPRNEWKASKSADATLKGEFIDLVENRGGQTNPGSVYGLAQQLGYASLPDLFFNTHVYDLEKVDAKVEKLKFNKNVKNVLKRKLYQFINWKLKTDHELQSRKTFTLKYLRQHWDVIAMYMSWIKPYLRHIARLQMNEQKLNTPDLIGAFEQSFIETEVLFAKGSPKKGVFFTILLTINFRTRPALNYQQEGYQRGPIHVGQADIYFRAYHWTDQHIQNYLHYRREEDLYMLGVVDKSVQAAMEALGEELEKYLAEAGEPKYKDKVEAEKKKAAEAAAKKATSGPSLTGGLFEPFSALGGAFGDLFGIGSMKGLFSLKMGKEKKTTTKFQYYKTLAEGGKVGKLGAPFYQSMKNYKKAHGMLSWG